MEELKEIVRVMRNIGILIAGVSFIILMIKTAIDPDQKPKYIKLAKNVLTACVLIILSLSLVEIPKTYFGSTATITDGQTTEITFGQIVDKDCQDREVVNIDGKTYVVTDTNVQISALTENTIFIRDTTSPEGITMSGKYVLKNCSILRAFSECQGTFKVFFADIKYYRDADGIIFPAISTYTEYQATKVNGGTFINGGRKWCGRWWRKCKIKKK